MYFVTYYRVYTSLHSAYYPLLYTAHQNSDLYKDLHDKLQIKNQTLQQANDIKDMNIINLQRIHEHALINMRHEYEQNFQG